MNVCARLGVRSEDGASQHSKHSRKWLTVLLCRDLRALPNRPVQAHTGIPAHPETPCMRLLHTMCEADSDLPRLKVSSRCVARIH